MRPKIIFHHAKLLEPFFEAYTLEKQSDYVQPPLDDFLKSLEENKKEWGKVEKVFIKTIKKTFKLSFHRKVLDIYVVRGARMSMSKPIIIKFNYNPKLFQYSLIHELTHVLLVNNKIKPGFSDEKLNTRNHIHLFAFVEKIYREVFKDEEMLKEIKILSTSEEYKRAWEIVEKEGYNKLIKELVRKNHTPIKRIKMWLKEVF